MILILPDLLNSHRHLANLAEALISLLQNKPAAPICNIAIIIVIDCTELLSVAVLTVMRYTPYRGLTAVKNWVRLKFAAMNLKKFVIHKDYDRKRQEGHSQNSNFLLDFTDSLFQILKPEIRLA